MFHANSARNRGGRGRCRASILEGGNECEEIGETLNNRDELVRNGALPLVSEPRQSVHGPG